MVGSLGCGARVWGGGAAASPVKKYFFLYNSSIVRVSASYSSDLTVILMDSVPAAGSRTGIIYCRGSKKIVVYYN